MIKTLCLGRLKITHQALMDSNLPVDSHRPAYRSRVLHNGLNFSCVELMLINLL